MPHDRAPDTEVYLRMMRLHQPTGVWLLMWPCWWGVALASPEFPSALTLFLFFVGAFLMRPVGCIINDITDRDLDRQVARTRNRPLASGEMTVGEAVRLAIWLLLFAFGVALLLGMSVVWWSLAALPLVVVYPLMKRVTWWPQLFLGLTFNWGALVGWVAIRGMVELPAVLLYAGGIFWTLGYDTIYAHQDKTDDQMVGIKSTALRLKKNTKPALLVFYTLAVLCWAQAGNALHAQLIFYILLGLIWLHLVQVTARVNLESPESCFEAFSAHIVTGWLLFLAALLADGKILGLIGGYLPTLPWL
jgi:4-hydroxybenzoate polyprenyltransferase